MILFNLNDKIIWIISDSFFNLYWKKIGFDSFKKIWFDFDSGPVCYFRLAIESDDSVAESVRLDFYCFVDEISF